MHRALRRATELFQQVLRSVEGRNPPRLVSISVDRDLAYDQLIFTALFHNDGLLPSQRRVGEASGDIRCRWEMDRSEVEDNRWGHNLTPGELTQEFRTLWYRLCEDHMMERQLATTRKRLLDAVRLNANPTVIEALRRNLDEMTAHFRQYPSYSAMQASRVPPGGSVSIGYAITRNAISDNLFGRLFGDHQAAEDAKKKAQDLLRSWLSPDQAKQYDEKKYFEVVGSDTKKRYRVYQGRQQNVWEVDEKGDKVCGWCFLPEGNLVEGDVMLGQKIALETNEREALKKANKFGQRTPPMSREDQRMMQYIGHSAGWDFFGELVEVLRP